MGAIKPSQRFEEIVKTFENQGFGQFFKGKRKTSESLGKTPEKRLREAFERLKGGFLLGGIFLAHRVDLLPTSYCKELSRIKDVAHGINFDDIERTIIKDLGRPVNTLFDKMWEKPSESDTLTQIHKAKLINGDIVFVKVIKEKVIKSVKEDIIIAKYLVEQTTDKEIHEKIKSIIHEFSNHINKKKTLRAEQTFLQNSAKSYGSDYMPTPIEHLCTDKVLVFTFERNKAKEENKYATIQKNIKTINGEMIMLIVGIILIFLGVGLTGTMMNIGSFIGTILLSITLLLSIQTKIKK